jgi:HEAT repeat protein
LVAGYGDELDTTAQAEYDRLFPSPPEIAERLERLAARLADTDSKVRLNAVKEIARDACKESSKKTQEWLRNPQLTALLTTALTDPVEEVHDHAVTALAEIARRYFRDRRALPALLTMLQSPRVLARAWACDAVETLAGSEALGPILPLLADSEAKVRASALSAIGEILGRPLKKADRLCVRDGLLGLIGDKNIDIRITVAGLLGALGDHSTTPLLAEWRKKEKSREVKQEISAAIARLNGDS